MSADLLEEFLSSGVVRGIEYIEAGDLRTISTRFFEAIGGIGADPGALSPEELRATLERGLPPLYPAADPLGQRTIDVLRTYLAFLEPRTGPERARRLVEALEECAEPLREKIRSG